MIMVLNCETLAISEYSLGWTDVVVLGGNVYGLGSGGVKMLSGALEAGTTPLVATGMLQPLGGQEFNLPKLSVGAGGTGDCTITTTTLEHGTAQENTPITFSMVGEVDQYEVVLGTANVARGYQLEMEFPADATVLSVGGYVNPVRHRRA